MEIPSHQHAYVTSPGLIRFRAGSLYPVFSHGRLFPSGPCALQQTLEGSVRGSAATAGSSVAGDSLTHDHV